MAWTSACAGDPFYFTTACTIDNKGFHILTVYFCPINQHIYHLGQYHTSALLVLLDLVSLKHTVLSDTITLHILRPVTFWRSLLSFSNNICNLVLVQCHPWSIWLPVLPINVTYTLFIFLKLFWVSLTCRFLTLQDQNIMSVFCCKGRFKHVEVWEPV